MFFINCAEMSTLAPSMVHYNLANKNFINFHTSPQLFKPLPFLKPNSIGIIQRPSHNKLITLNGSNFREHILRAFQSIVTKQMAYLFIYSRVVKACWKGTIIIMALGESNGIQFVVEGDIVI
jgi:hypothetical protein